MTNIVFWTKKEKHNNNKTKKHTSKSMPEPGIEPGSSRTAVRGVTSTPETTAHVEGVQAI